MGERERAREREIWKRERERGGGKEKLCYHLTAYRFSEARSEVRYM